MKYEKFISEVVKQDRRNIIKKCDKDLLECEVPVELDCFYKTVDIVDVEVVLKDLCSIKFYSCNQLPELQTEYGLSEEVFIFATKEGDPIFIKDGKVFSSVHGIGEYTFDVINKSFDEFIYAVISCMK